MKKFVCLLFCLFTFNISFAKEEKVPSCYGNEDWATQSALVGLVNAGYIKDFGSIYRAENDPFSLKTELLRSEKIGYFRYEKRGKEFPLYSLVQKVTVETKEGDKIEAFVFSQATEIECSMSGVDVVVTYPKQEFLSSKRE